MAVRTNAPRVPGVRARALVLALVLAAGAGALRAQAGTADPSPSAAGAEQQGTEETPAEKRAVDALLHELDAATELAHEERVARLTALGAEGMPWLFEVLATVQYVVFDPYGEPHPVRLNQRLGEALIDALEAGPRAPLLALLEGQGEDAASPGHREAALRLLGTFGTPEELPLAVRLAALPAGGEDGAPRSFDGLLERVVTATLRRHDEGCARVPALLRTARPDLHPALVRGLGRVGTTSALEALADAFTGDEHVDALVLNQIARLSVRLPLPAPTQLVQAVRRQLGSASAAVVREAALAAGRLEDSEAIQALIELLDSGDPGLVGNAHWALVRTTGLALRPDSERWRAWYHEELEWWREESAELFGVLAEGEPAQVAAAINEIASRRAFRHELAAELAGALDHPDPGVRALACGALGRLGSRASTEPLVARVEDPDPAIREAAWQALRAITGLDLPPEQDAWRKAL